MPGKQTTNYKLSQWVKTDKVLMDDFNDDNAKIDAALAAKAEQSALEALQTVVDGKASMSEVNSVKSTVSGQGTALALRNCAIYHELYTGDGSATRTFSFSSKPLMVILSRELDPAFMLLRNSAYVYPIGGDIHDVYSTVTWTTNSVSVTKAVSLCNQKDVSYVLLAFLQL